MGGGGEEYPNHTHNHNNNHNHSSNRNNKHYHSSNHHSSRDSAMQSRWRSGSAAPFPRNVTIVEVVSCGCSSPYSSSMPSLYSSRRGSATAGRIRSGLGGGNAAGEVSKIWPLFRNDHHHVDLLMLKHRRSSLNNKHPADALGAAAFRTKKPNSDTAAAAVASATIIKSPPPPQPLPPPPPSSSFFFQSSFPHHRPSFNGSSGRVNGNPWLASQRSSVSSNPEADSVTRANCDQGSVNTLVRARKKPAVHYHDDHHHHHHHLQLRDALYKEELADALEREFKKAGYLCNGRPKPNQTSSNHHYSFFGDEDAVVETVQGEEDWRDDYTAIDSPPQIDQHSSPAQYCTATRSDHELQADDYSRAELESVAHGAYSALKNLSRCLIATHCKRMKKTTNDSKQKSDNVDAVEEILGRLMPDAEFARPSHFKHGIEACLHRIVLEDFDTESYGVHHRVQGHFSSPCLRKASFLREFRLFEMHSAEKLVDAECDEFSSSFHSFCLRKRDAISVEIIDHPRGEEDVVAGMLNSESYQWPLKLLQVFLDAMRRVWMMHRLSFAMDPPAKIFRPFNDCNMEVLQIRFRKTTLSDDCLDGMEFRAPKPFHCEKEAAEFIAQSDNGRLGKASGRKLELLEDLGHNNYIAEKAFAVEKKTRFSTQHKPYHCKEKAGFFTREAVGRGSEIYSEDLRDNYVETSVVEKEMDFSVHKPYHHEKKAAFSACPEVRRIGQAVGRELEYAADLDEDDYGTEEEDMEFYAHEPYQRKKKAGLECSEAPEEHKLCNLNIEGIKPLPEYDDKMIDQGIKNLPKSGDKMIEGIKPLPKFGDQTTEGIKPLPKFDDKIMEPVHLDDVFTERMQFVVMPGFVLPQGDVLVKSKVYLQPWNGISPSKNISRFS